jgi:hypothetical protein
MPARKDGLPFAPRLHVHSKTEVRDSSIPEHVFIERDRMAELDARACADDINVALGLNPPPYRSALMRRGE